MRYFVFFFLIYGLVSCQESDKPTLQLDENAWLQTICCDKFENLKIAQLLYIEQGAIAITFCNVVSSEKRISLFEVNESEKKLLFDLMGQFQSNEKTVTIKKGEPPKKLKGEFNFNGLQEGRSYKIYVGTKKTCGEVLFQVKQGKIIDLVFKCANKC